MKKEFIVFSDLHLENFSNELHAALVVSINKLIKEKREQGIDPILLAPGDIHNGTMGFDFLNKLDVQSFYTAGNHEFWGNDYFELNDELNQKSNDKVKYLQNEISLIDDKYLIVGATMWTDGGKTVNPSIKSHVGSKTNDIFYINAKQWHENKPTPEDERKKDKWNIDIQLEENQKTIDFFICFNNVFSFVEELKSGFFIYDKEKKLNFDVLRKDFFKVKNFRQYLNLIQKLDDFDVFKYKYSKDFKESLSTNRFFDLFLKLKNVEKVQDLKIIFMTHHAPFLEELWLATHDRLQHTEKLRMLNPVREDLFLAKDPNGYLDHNYLFRCAKGDYTRYEDVTIVYNYYNNLSLRLPTSLIKRISAWVHGHDHYVNFEKRIKNIFVVNNAVGYGMHHIKKENMQEQLDNLVSKEFRIINDEKISKDVPKTKFMLEAMEFFDFNELADNLEKIEHASITLFKLSHKVLNNRKFNQKEYDFYISGLTSISDAIHKQMQEYILHVDLQIEEDMNVDQIIMLRNNIVKGYNKYDVFMPNGLFDSLLGMVPRLKREALSEQDIDFDMQTFYQLKEVSRIAKTHVQKMQTKFSVGDLNNLLNEQSYRGYCKLYSKDLYKKTYDKWEKIKSKYGVQSSYMIGGF